jgi:hypothetical protein
VEKRPIEDEDDDEDDDEDENDFDAPGERCLVMTSGTRPSTCRFYESLSRHSQASPFKS